MVSSSPPSVFHRLTWRKLTLLTLLLFIGLVFHQATVMREAQITRLEAARQAEQTRLQAEQQADRQRDYPAYNDTLITDIFNAMLAPPYSKLDIYGKQLPPSADHWQCVRSNDTNLVWEVKTRDGGLRDAQHTYTWFTRGDKNGVPASGRADGGACLYSDCDTEAYLDTINRQKLCGLENWRLPTTEELQSLVYNSAYIPKIDPRYFPNTRSYYYWSNTIYAHYYDPEQLAHFPGVQAFQYWSEILAINDYSIMTSVNFLNGLAYGARKQRTYHIRLVSGKP